MVQVSYPGIYIEELPSSVHTITSVATSIAAFFGRASKGPLNRPVRCLSLADYLRAFGAPNPKSDLGLSVRQFFANGGSDCYIVRLAHGAQKAAITLHSLASAAPQPVLRARAKAEGEWANTVQLLVDYNTANPHDSFNLRVIQKDGELTVASESFINLSMNPASPRFAPTFVTQSSALLELVLDASIDFTAAPPASVDGFSQARRPLPDTSVAAAVTLNGLITSGKANFDISVNDSSYVTVSLAGWTFPSVNFVTMGSAFASRINSALTALSPVPSVTASFDVVVGLGCFVTVSAASGDKMAVRIRRAASRDLAGALMFGVDQGGLEIGRFSNLRPAPTASLLRVGNPGATTVTAASSTLNALAALPQTPTSTVTIDGTALHPPLQTDPAPTALWVNNAPGASPATGDSDGVREKLHIIAATVNAEATLAFRAEVWGYHLALLPKSGAVNTLPVVTATPSVISSDLSLNTGEYLLGINGTSPFSSAGTKGDDGTAPTLTDYFGSPVDQSGFHALDPVDLFNLMVLPPDAEVPAADQLQLWGPAANYCAGRRAFLLVDAPADWTGIDNRPLVVGNTALIGTLGVSSGTKSNAAVFYPRLVIQDRGLNKKTGASGAVAGLMARIDSTRGVWKAPAGIEADLRDALGLEVKLTDPENGVLNKKGVNCLRIFPNGLVNWGARTLAGDDDVGSEWKYIPIRRLALNLEESLFRGTRWVIFEPNDEPLWAKIRLNLNAFMLSLFRQGAFQGTSPKDAFYVKCDKDTTTEDDRNKGIVNIEVGFAPLKPAEFVVIRIQQIAGDL